MKNVTDIELIIFKEYILKDVLTFTPLAKFLILSIDLTTFKLNLNLRLNKI